MPFTETSKRDKRWYGAYHHSNNISYRNAQLLAIQVGENNENLGAFGLSDNCMQVVFNY